MSIITSLLDNDTYKYSMMQPVLHQFSDTIVKYKFRCRNERIHLAKYKDEILYEIDHLCSLRFTEDELRFLDNIPFFKQSFISFLRNFKLNSDCVKISIIDGEI